MQYRVKGLDWRGDLFFDEFKSKPIGYLSVAGNGKCSYDLSGMKYYIISRERRVSLDLKIGYEKVIKKNVIPSHNIDEVLRWIRAHPKQLRDNDPQFICMRGAIIDLLMTPSKYSKAWIMCAAKFDGIIYLSMFRTKEKQLYEASKSVKQRRIDSWGYKFEQYMVRDHPMIPANTSKPVNENEEFCCFFYNEINNHKLIYAAEIDGVYSDRIITEETFFNCGIRFVELKTNKKQIPAHQRNYFYFKIARTWCQSVLSCIDKVVIGYRTQGGLVEDIKEYLTEDLLKICVSVFNPQEAKTFCEKFLEYLKRVVVEDHDKCIYKFTWDPRVSSSIQGDILDNTNNRSDYSFLPAWYTVGGRV